MKIVVSHLTRMRAPFICVAGIDLTTGKHVRPVLESGQLGRSLLVRHGGPFDIASVVNLGPARYTGRAPETEDCQFNRRKVSRLNGMAPADFWALLQQSSHVSLPDIFGGDLKRHGDSGAVDFGTGHVSLGTLRPTESARLTVNVYGRVRLRLHVPPGALWLSVTDLRFYQDDHVTPRREIVQRVARRIEEGAGVILTVGLGRPWHKEGDTAARHWLQVNNIHLQDDPTWQECAL